MFGDRLKDRRKELGLSQCKFTSYLGDVKNSSVISNWEGNTHLPSTKYLVPISKVLDISLDELFRDEMEEIIPFEIKRNEVKRKRKGFAMKLKHRRMELGLTQKELYKNINCKMNKNYISQIERNCISPNIEILIKLCKALNMSLDELFEYEMSNDAKNIYDFIDRSLVSTEENLGTKIKKIRMKYELSQTEFGKIIDTRNPLAKYVISNWELNRCLPSVKHIITIAGKFNVSIDELLENEFKEYEKLKNKVLEEEKI